MKKNDMAIVGIIFLIISVIFVTYEPHTNQSDMDSLSEAIESAIAHCEPLKDNSNVCVRAIPNTATEYFLMPEIILNTKGQDCVFDWDKIPTPPYTVRFSCNDFESPADCSKRHGMTLCK